MKRLLIASLAALSFAAPLAASVAYADDDDRRRRHHDRYNDRSHDRDWDDDDDDDDRGYRHERRRHRDGYREGRRYDRDRHNGYYVGRSWRYGPPPSAYYTRDDYHPGYRSWRRGDTLPSYYRERCRPVDWRHHNLSAPPRGYHWVRDDRGDYLLVGVATGLILGLVLGG